MELKSGKANLSRNLEGVAGVLTLDERVLRFESKGLNVQKTSEVVELDTISSIEKAWTKLFGAVPVYNNAFALGTTDGRQLRIAVKGRDEWIAAIEGARSAASAAAQAAPTSGSVAPPRASVPPPPA